MSPIRGLPDRVGRLLGRFRRRTEPALETIYRDLFLRDLERLGIKDDFYPVGGAASHSYLYLILRCLQELPISSVIELGAGQSTLLLHQVRQVLGGRPDIVTIEHDEDWAKCIGEGVDHPVVHRPLSEMTILGRPIQFYRPPLCDPGARFNAILIDGPVAASAESRFARLGALALIPNHCATDFVILIDDAERPGEAKLATASGSALEKAGIPFHETFVAGVKRQHVLCSPGFGRAAIF